jgi:hypothetical protein
VAETDTQVFVAADNSFSPDVHEYSVAYTWPFDVHDLADGLDTKALRGIMDRLGELNNPHAPQHASREGPRGG